jgi:hypothetical protein
MRILAYFDILGYTSFLKNNRAEEARYVVAKLNSLRGSALQELRDGFYSEEIRVFEKVNPLIDLIKWLVFADTILLYTEIDDSDAAVNRSIQWMLLHLQCLNLWRSMFEYGLPLRGVIHIGDLYVEEYCFAGCAIAEAYETSKDFDLAVLVYTNPAFSALVNQANEPGQRLWSYLSAQVFEYQLPQKEKKGEQFIAVNPFSVITPNIKWYDIDVKTFVQESFCKHGKVLTASAISKLHNTEQFLRSARYAIGNKYEIDRILRYSRIGKPGTDQANHL